MNARVSEPHLRTIFEPWRSRRDGQRAVKVESRLDCLAADASLENLAQVTLPKTYSGTD